MTLALTMPNGAALHTLGYTTPGSAETLDALMQDENMLIIDIRYSPHSRNRYWEGDEVMRRYLHPTLPIVRYQWLQALGNVNYRGGAIKLADTQKGIAFVVGCLEVERSVVLLCVCANYETCHRKVVVDLVRKALAEREVPPA